MTAQEARQSSVYNTEQTYEWKHIEELIKKAVTYGQRLTFVSINGMTDGCYALLLDLGYKIEQDNKYSVESYTISW